MRGKTRPLLLLLLRILLLSACAPLPQSAKLNARGTSTSTPFQPVSTFTRTPEFPPTPLPTETPLPSRTPTELSPPPSGTTTQAAPSLSPEPSLTAAESASATPEPTRSSASSAPVVRVSVTTNCRSGPGVSYTRISSLTPGKKAEIVGRNPLYPYWVVRDPWGSGRWCWLWNYYTSTQGDMSDLPVVDPPASQTPLPTGTVTASASPGPGLPSNTPQPPTATSTAVPPSATSPVTPGTPTHTSTPAPPPTNTPNPPPSPPPDSPHCNHPPVLAQDGQKNPKKKNRARREHGLSELQVDSRLVRAARDHGRDMTCHGTYSHTSTDGTRAWERISMALGHGPNWCYNHCCCSEIFYGGGGYLTPSQAFNWWMTHESQDPNYEDNIHKRTILSQYSTHIGVGAIYYYDGSTVRKFYTVDFARP